MAGEDPRLIAHRGFAAEFPENTATAVREAVRYADGIEVDVRQCGSGELVTVHDARIGPRWRQRRVADLSIAAVREAAPLPADATVPTVDELLAMVPENQRFILELKTPTAAQPIAEMLDDVDGDVMVSAGNPRSISRLSRFNPTVPTAYVHIPSRSHRTMWPIAKRVPGALDTVVDLDAVLQMAADLGCEEVHLRYELCLRTDVVERAHDRGLGVGAWTVESPQDFDALADVGVDWIFADTWRIRDHRSSPPG